MKILQVVPFFSPAHGGSAAVPYYISKELAKRGHDVTIFTSDYKLSPEWTKSLHQVHVFPFKTRLSLAKFHVTPSMVKHARQEVTHFDLIHMHSYRSFQNLVAHHYARKYDVPYVLQAHGTLPRIIAKQKLKWIYDAFFGLRLLKDASKNIALSQTEVQQYRSMGVSMEKITMVPNGIDMSNYADLPPRGLFKERFKIPTEKKLVLYLGRIHKIKGIDYLVRAYAYLVKDLKFNDAVLAIVGPDDGYLGEIQVLIKALMIKDNVFVTGPLYGMNKLAAYVDADVYVLPSRYEIWGLTVLEAYACSKPVIASRVDGLRDLILDEVTGLPFDPGNVKQLARSIFDLLSNDERARQAGIKGRNFVEENFTIEKVADKIEKVYNEVNRTSARDESKKND